MSVDIEHIDDEDDVSFGLRFAAALEAAGHEWGADVETACFVLAREVERQRAVIAKYAEHRQELENVIQWANGNALRVSP